MGALTQGRGNGAILSSSYLHVLPRSQLTAAGLRAAGYEPQLRVRPGPGMGSAALTMNPFPHLSLPQQLSWHHLGHWAPLTLHSGAAGPVVRGPFAQRGSWAHGCARGPPLQSWGAVGRGMEGTRPALPWDKSQGSAPCSHGVGIKGYLSMHHPVWCNALALGWIRIP